MESVNNQTKKETSVEEKNNKVPTNQTINVFVVAVIMLFLGFVAIILLRDFGFLDQFLFIMAFKNGINPTIPVLIISAILLGGSIYFFKQSKKQKSHPYYLIPAFLLLSLGLSNLGVWIANDGKIQNFELNQKQREQYLIISKENEGFSYIGEVEGKKYDGDNEKTEKFYLFVKVIAGKRYYYCSCITHWFIEDYLVEKYDNKRGIADGYIFDFDFDWDNIYVRNKVTGNEDHAHNVTAQATIGSSSSCTSDEASTIVVEHQRQAVPVQEWVPCGTCMGAKYCQTCGGNGWVYSASTSTGMKECVVCRGSKECTTCNGQGGRYETFYR